MDELKARITRAIPNLERLAAGAFDAYRDEEAARLRGKAEGLRLTLSYIEEMTRG